MSSAPLSDPPATNNGSAALVVPDPWSALRAHTPANIAIGRVGHSLPTREVLRFGLAHAQARDAVHVALDSARLACDLGAAGCSSTTVHSAAADGGPAARQTYLCRPDLGRRLSAASARQLDALAAASSAAPELCVVIGDGLSAVAVQNHAVPLLQALRARWRDAGRAWLMPPVVIATEARVALGDEIAERLRARMVLVLIGERPGLSSPDSLGIYATWSPRVGRSDAERNCISNVRAEGLSYAAAAFKLAWLIEQAFRRALTGVALKDESDLVAINATSALSGEWLAPPRAAQ